MLSGHVMVLDSFLSLLFMSQIENIPQIQALKIYIHRPEMPIVMNPVNLYKKKAPKLI
jgi:hypothetical protein